MRKTPPASSPAAYLRALKGWRCTRVKELRVLIHNAAAMEEVIKWGHLVFLKKGPVLLIRAEAERVLFGFWRGKRLRRIEPRLKASGKYEMATLELHEEDTIESAVVRRLVVEAVLLNEKLGNPTDAVKRR